MEINNLEMNGKLETDVEKKSIVEQNKTNQVTERQGHVSMVPVQLGSKIIFL